MSKETFSPKPDFNDLYIPNQNIKLEYKLTYYPIIIMLWYWDNLLLVLIKKSIDLITK